MDAWVVWLIVAMALGIAELLSLTLYLALVSAAAIVAMLVAALGLGAAFQFVAFAVSAVLLIVFVRPLAQHALRKVPVMRSGTAALVGREALVLSEVSRHTGRVRIGGEEWTARPYDSSLVIPAGATVDVFAIEGATALVHPQEEPWAN
ncbi:NfeD family protein [Actinopolymorpha alba]|uniref:NfeD family protein n=1 Tax=Actinopolymorpha alba TaxID=533267 RepID=UPI00036E07A8|nr:NfeD family protein [Actinopolymorpha alba]